MDQRAIGSTTSAQSMAMVMFAILAIPISLSSYLDELERLAALRDQGIITEEEFAAKKGQLLNL